MSYQRVAEADALADGELMPVELEDGLRLCLARIDGRWHASQNSCTHADYPLSDGSLDGCMLECMLHGAIFDLRDGSVVEGPAVEALKIFEVKIEDGGVWIDV